MTSDESIQQFADELAARNVNLDGVVLMPPQDPPTSDPLPSSAKWREILQNSFVGPLALLEGGHRHHETRSCQWQAMQDRHHLRYRHPRR